MKKAFGMTAGISGIVLAIIGIKLKVGEDGTAVSVIGGADGPTSIFLAGKLDGGFTAGLVIAGIALLAAAVAALIRRRR